MKRGYPPLWLGFFLLLAALCWRLMGAPISPEQFSELKTPLWQMRVLTPSRIHRMLTLWMPAPTPPAQGETLAEDGVSAEERALERVLSGQPDTLRVWLSQSMTEMPLESYVCGVVAAEMPAAYHVEALKAQAVAARTRALRQRADGGCPVHEGADICGNSACCQGCASTAACREKWGAEYDLYRERILDAVQQTAGEVLTYEGQPIAVLYHAISGGQTESAQAVFAQELPYLVSVNSEGEEQARGFTEETRFSFQAAAEKLNLAFDGLNATAEQIRRTLAAGSFTPAGRVATVIVGQRTLDGPAFRQALGLRSTWFTITMDQDGVAFHQRGYGHGVGMSQVGANAMAANGAAYRAILAHYYPGTALEKR